MEARQATRKNRYSFEEPQNSRAWGRPDAALRQSLTGKMRWQFSLHQGRFIDAGSLPVFFLFILFIAGLVLLIAGFQHAGRGGDVELRQNFLREVVLAIREEQNRCLIR